MTRLTRPILAGLLSLLIALTGLGMAVARPGVLPGDGRVLVLCSGGGLMQVEIGADGKPTGKSHICPDLAATALAALTALAVELPAPAARFAPARPVAAGHQLATGAVIRLVARGPPFPA